MARALSGNSYVHLTCRTDGFDEIRDGELGSPLYPPHDLVHFLADMRQLRVILPVLAGAAAGAIVALAIGGGTTTRTVTTTTAVPASRSAEPASLGPTRGLPISGIYRKAGPGVVDITTSSRGTSGIFGFGQPRTQ